MLSLHGIISITAPSTLRADLELLALNLTETVEQANSRFDNNNPFKGYFNNQGQEGLRPILQPS